MKKLRQFDVGVLLEFPITEDAIIVPIVGSSNTVTFQPPGVASFVRAAFIHDGPGGVAGYITVPGDLGWWGLWRAQVHTIFSGGLPNVHTTTYQFEVEPLLGPVPIFIRPAPVQLVSIPPAVLVT